jgi:hypothetical protein
MTKRKMTPRKKKMKRKRSSLMNGHTNARISIWILRRKI